MKGKLVLLIAAIIMFSCSKNNIEPFYPASSANNNVNPKMKEGGEDDDGPIIIRIVSDQLGNPLTDAHLSLTHNSETFETMTNDHGQATIQLSELGTWNYSVDYMGETYIITQLHVADSVCYGSDTLHLE